MNGRGQAVVSYVGDVEEYRNNVCLVMYGVQDVAFIHHWTSGQ